MTKKIFTFWEQTDTMPDYIKMCINSWRKFLPDYEIIVLNHSNIGDYIGREFYDKILYEKFTLAQQSQAIRAAILNKQGGIWFDADIIVTSSDIEQLFDQKSELNIFDNRIACLKARKGSKILTKWVKGIKWNLFLYKHFFNFCFEYFPYLASDMMNWDYLSNNILCKLYRTKNKKRLNNISIYSSKTYPEILWDKECNHGKFKGALPDGYNYFYIKNDFSDFALKNNNGLIILHNSWMPREYAQLNKDEILKKSNTLSKLLQKFGT